MRLTRSPVASGLGALLLLQACSHPQVQVPPRMELSRWPTLGIVEFRDPLEPQLASLATSQFVQMLHSAQPGTPILELGSAARVLAEVQHAELDFEAARAIGERYGVDAIFTGELGFDAPKPRLSVGGAFESVAARADVTGRLVVRLLDARSGASVWSDSSSASAPVAHFDMAQGTTPVFDASDPRDARLDLLHALVSAQRYDFYPSWQDR